MMIPLSQEREGRSEGVRGGPMAHSVEQGWPPGGLSTFLPRAGVRGDISFCRLPLSTLSAE